MLNLERFALHFALIDIACITEHEKEREHVSDVRCVVIKPNDTRKFTRPLIFIDSLFIIMLELK